VDDAGVGRLFIPSRGLDELDANAYREIEGSAVADVVVPEEPEEPEEPVEPVEPDVPDPVEPDVPDPDVPPVPVPDPDPVPDPVPTPPTSPVNLVVNNEGELQTALASVAGGQTIGLSSFFNGRIDCSRRFLSMVTITAVNPVNPPIVTSIRLDGTSNLRITGVSVVHPFVAGEAAWYNAIEIFRCSNIWMENNEIREGRTADGYGATQGTLIRWCDNVHYKSNRIRGFVKQNLIMESRDCSYIDNDIAAMRSDGLSVVDCSANIIIESNHIHDMSGKASDTFHRDGIEFWRVDETPSNNMTGFLVKDNLIDIGAGPWFQSIFGRNTTAAQFLGNRIINYHLHGITPNAAVGVIIRDNVLIHRRSAHPANDNANIQGAVSIPQINLGGTWNAGTVIGNVTPTPIPAKAGWIMSGNTTN